jgi:hypothetical protein
MTAVKEPQAQLRSTAGLQKAIEDAIIGSDCPSRFIVTEEIKELACRLANGEPNDIAPSQLCEAAELPPGSTWGEALKVFEEQIDASERHDHQVDVLIDLLTEQRDLYVPFEALMRAVFDVVEIDFPQHNATMEELLPEAVERAKEYGDRMASWDWKADHDEIQTELNRVLKPYGLRFVPVDGCDDVVTFELEPENK